MVYGALPQVCGQAQASNGPRPCTPTGNPAMQKTISDGIIIKALAP